MTGTVEEIVIGDLFPELKYPEIKDLRIHIDSLAGDVASEFKYAFGNYR